LGAVDVGGPKKKGGKRKPMRRGVRIDMTPMVDVAFLLLIFFMVTTVFRRPQALEITLPTDKNEVEIPENNVMQIRVQETGKAFWNIGMNPPVEIPVNDLHQVVEQSHTANPALCAVIKIERKAPYHYMVDVLDEVEIGNLKRFSLAPFQDEDRQVLAGETPGTETPTSGGKGS
jgi:biopolymer transport protein ExbD